MTVNVSLQRRLVYRISLSLFLFAVLVGSLIYKFSFDNEVADAITVEQQLVRTVQIQAEVALYAANAAIAKDIIEGLRANPRITAVRIKGSESNPFDVSGGFLASAIAADSAEYPLFSPINAQQRIGLLTVIRNSNLIRAEATMTALGQAALMLIQIIVTAVLITYFARRLISEPVHQLAKQLDRYRPDSGVLIAVPHGHDHDEIGSLTNSANALIEAAQAALLEVRKLAATDGLTGLLNRRSFMSGLDGEHARLRRFETQQASVIMFDLDYFKRINDSYGHAAGDQVLRHFAVLLAQTLREVDIVGRLGGEEFAALLPGADCNAAVDAAERIRTSLQGKPIRWDDSVLTATVSIGIASLQATDTHPDEALARADSALYQAKNRGRNCVVVFEQNAEPPTNSA